MKKLAMNLLKTADEKLRNISKPQNQSATVVQTQDFTYVKHLPKRQDVALKQIHLQEQTQEQLHQQKLQRQQSQYQQTPQHQQQQQLQQRLEEEIVAAVTKQQRQQLSPLPHSENMAERVILRSGRRDRNGYRAADEPERSEIKRRSRSEGPNRRVRQSMDEREGGKKLTYDGGGRRQQDSSDSSDSVRQIGCAGKYDSDSDSDPKKWTKNPLIIRRAKRPDKGKQNEKRLSGTENGSATKSRESWVYYGNEDASSGSLGGGNSSSRDGVGSGGKGSSKYQKLEEMRKKRINLAVTSDEESTPASRISRLRQRAIQSGLGEQARFSTPLTDESAHWEKVGRQQQKQSPATQSFISPHSGVRKFPVTSSEMTEPSRAVTVRPNYSAKITPITQSPSFTPQFYSQPSSNAQPVHTAAGARTSGLNIQPISRTTGIELSHQPAYLQQNSSIVQQSTGQKQTPIRPLPANMTGIRQSFHTIPEPTSVQTTRGLYEGSPEVAPHKLTTPARVPSFDSILDSTASIKESSSPLIFSPIPHQALGDAHQGISQSPSQFNEVVELRLKSTKDDRSKSQPKVAKKTLRKTGVLGQSDDSLDELIESNIQYLDSEIDKVKPKKNASINVSRSSSLPDPRRMASHTSPVPAVHEQPAIQVQASTSIQFHVSLPADAGRAPGIGPPIIHIAPSNVIDYAGNYSYDSQMRSQPDVVPRKYSYDSHSRISRPSSEYYDRDDLSKSDSQLNTQPVVPSYLGNNLHPDQAYARGCVSDINLQSSSTSNSLQAPQMDKGMFSDVEYDIEVSERVKKWETFMKVQDTLPVVSEKKNQNLCTIQENNESESLMLPSEVRKSVLLSKQGALGAPVSRELATYTPATKPRPYSSDTSIHKSGDTASPKVFSLETTAHRFFQVIQDPQAGPRLGHQSQSVSSVFHAPLTIRPEKNLISANDIRQQMLANRRPAFPLTSGPMPATYQPALPLASTYQSLPQQDKLINTTSKVAEMNKKGSRYQEELDELSNVKSDSVVNLRRRFDTDSATVTSEDDQKSVSTASAKLSRPSKQSPSQKGADSVDWSKMFPGYQSKIKENTEVWSPNLETTQGVPVSIERVTARTLQTIPFSEDPFWKEIEELTSFDPNTLAGHLSPNNTQEPLRSQHQLELASPHSSTLPNQPRNNVMSTKERMQRSKSLYTPNITPLTISVNDTASSNAVSALDEVLDDISRSSMERRQMSPKKRAVEMEMSSSTSSAVANMPGYVKAKPVTMQPTYKFEGGQFTFLKPGLDSSSQPVKSFETSNIPRPDPIPSQTKQPLQFYQQQRLQQLNQQALQQQLQHQQQNRQSQMLPGGNNNYQLDPDLLKQKLLSTGLVVETDTEEMPSAALKHFRSSSLGSAVPTYVSYSAAVTTYASMSTQSVPSSAPNNYISSTTATYSENAPPIISSTSNEPRQVIPSGTSALDDIQKALAPFSTSYQPGPESLYGTSTLESFKDSRFDTTRGPATTGTSWSYQPQPQKEKDADVTSLPNTTTAASSRLQQVNESMDDLKDLAQSVERKINVIKLKLQSADEKSLDSILASLRKVTPETSSQDFDPASFRDYYAVKKSKLSEALSELDRIYKNLHLNNDDMPSASELDKYRPYTATKSSDFIIAPQPKSEHLRPMQTRISSIFVPGLETKAKNDLDKETESEFDFISRSFQAIVDEVNHTSDMFSRASERNKQENTAPETQKQTFKITLKPGDTSLSNVPSTKPFGPSSKEETPKGPPAIAPKPQETKSKGGRFRSKAQDTPEDDESSIKKSRSKSVPGMDSNTADLLSGSISSSLNTNPISSTPVSTTANITTTTISTSASTPPLAARRQRVRPVRDNRIIQDDRLARRDSSEKLLGVSSSPQPSPKVTRKIIYNSGMDLDVKLQPPQMFQDAPEDKSTETTSQQQISVRQQTQKMEDKFISKPAGAETKPIGISSPALHKKVATPTVAKPLVKSEISVPTPASPTSKNPSAIPVLSKNEANRVAENLQLNIGKLMMSDSSSSIGSGQTMTSSSASINLTPPVPESNQPKPLLIGGSKQDTALDTDSGGQRSKRRLGTGVAMMLDKFSSGEDSSDRLKKQLGTRSAPDLTGAANSEPKDDDCEETSNKQTTSDSRVPASTKTGVTSSPSSIKSSVYKVVEKKTPILAAEGNKSPLVRPTVVSSLERKIIGPEAKAASSCISPPQPSSPNNKPPHHPWKRQTSDPERQSIAEVIQESRITAAVTPAKQSSTEVQESKMTIPVSSPKFVSKIPRLVSTPATSTTTALVNSGVSSPKGTQSPHQGLESPKVVPRRVRPSDRKIQTASSFSERPHSFHELLSCFEQDPHRLQGNDKFRKYASADAVNSHTACDKVFRSERNLTTIAKPKGESHELVVKFEMKRKS